MRIKLLHNYGGTLTGERRIEPGEYDATDERLFGLADYLVANGHARVVELAWFVPDGKVYTTETFTTESGASWEPPAFDYETTTVAELRAELERRGVDLNGVQGSGKNGRLTKDDLFLLLRDSE